MESENSFYAKKIKKIETKKGNCQFMSYKDIATKKGGQKTRIVGVDIRHKNKRNRRIYK